MRACIRYLSFDVFQQDSDFDDTKLRTLLKDHALLRYASQHQSDHARRATIDGTSEDMMLEFLQDDAKVTCASQLYLSNPPYGKDIMPNCFT